MLRQDWQIHRRGVTAVLGTVDNTSFITSTNTTEIQDALSVDPKLPWCLFVACTSNVNVLRFSLAQPSGPSATPNCLTSYLLTNNANKINVLVQYSARYFASSTSQISPSLSGANFGLLPSRSEDIKVDIRLSELRNCPCQILVHTIQPIDPKILHHGFKWSNRGSRSLW
jgi:hypothetical protein